MHTFIMKWFLMTAYTYVRLGHTVFAFTAEDQPYTLLLFFQLHQMPVIEGLFI